MMVKSSCSVAVSGDNGSGAAPRVVTDQIDAPRLVLRGRGVMAALVLYGFKLRVMLVILLGMSPVENISHFEVEAIG